MNLSTSATRYSRDRQAPRKTYSSETRVDIALLASALFLQRFGLPFFHTRLTFDFVFAALIFAHQFGTGRLFIQYDRLFWFLVVLTAATCSLLLNFQSSMLASYALFVLLYFLFTVSRRATPEQYQDTLQGFQFLVLILSCLGICQYLTKFIVDPGKLAMFFGIFPSSLLPYAQSGIVSGQKINGIFLVEAATMSQIMALGVLIEILRFRRPRYLLLLTLALLLAYTGTGLTILLIGLPLAFLMNKRVQLPVLLIGLFACVLLTMGIIHLSAFASRLQEFSETQSSGFVRFVSPFWMAADYFPTASIAQLLCGNGPHIGFVPKTGDLIYHASGSAWFNLIYYYGLIGAFVFICFSLCCFRSTRCPIPLLVTLIYYQWMVSNIVGTSTLIIMVVLCTLNGPKPRRRRVDKALEYQSALPSGVGNRALLHQAPLSSQPRG
jgi:hypothetical protein